MYVNQSAFQNNSYKICPLCWDFQNRFLVCIVELFSRKRVSGCDCCFSQPCCLVVYCVISHCEQVFPQKEVTTLCTPLKIQSPGDRRCWLRESRLHWGCGDVVSWGLMVWSGGEKRGAGELGPFLGHPVCCHQCRPSFVAAPFPLCLYCLSY